MVTTLINIYKFREWTLVAWHDSVIADGSKGDVEWDVKTKKGDIWIALFMGFRGYTSYWHFKFNGLTCCMELDDSIKSTKL